jgi:hypothetical protein
MVVIYPRLLHHIAEICDSSLSFHGYRGERLLLPFYRICVLFRAEVTMQGTR